MTLTREQVKEDTENVLAAIRKQCKGKKLVERLQTILDELLVAKKNGYFDKFAPITVFGIKYKIYQSAMLDEIEKLNTRKKK